MFNNSGIEASTMQPCRPDPEEQLKGIRKRKAVAEEAQKLLTRLSKLSIHFNNHNIEQTTESAIKVLVGELYLQLDTLNDDETRILADIDKSTT